MDCVHCGRKRSLVYGASAAFGDDPAEIFEHTVLVLKLLADIGGFLFEADLDALVQIAGDLEPLANEARVELHLREHRRIGMEEHRRPGSSRRTELFQRADRFALAEAHFPLRAIALDGRHELA